MDKLEIQPLAAPPHATVRVPGSKSITNRALVLAAMCGKGSTCEIHGALRSEDTELMIDGLRKLGFHIESCWDQPDSIISVHSEEGTIIPAAEANLVVGNSGTTMRFLTALASVGDGYGVGRYRLDGVPRMRERPIQDLLDALSQLGVRAWSELGNGCPPVIVETEGWKNGRVRIRGSVSSQFLSGLLLAAPFARKEMEIAVEGNLVSEPYVAMTVAMLRDWHVAAVEVNDASFYVRRRPEARLGYTIEPDASAASYFWGAAALSAGEVRVDNITTNSIQGDVRFVEILEDMGCTVIRGQSGLTVRGAPLHGIDVDMNDISDTVMTLGAVACFAEGPTTIRNVAHIRHKETDRLAALATELRRVGAEVDEFPDGLKITPRPLHGAEIETYNDHRMAMSMALIGLKVPGIVIKNPGCVAKTYPGFWVDLEKLRTV